MSNTIKTIYHGARSWWHEYRALPRESKHLFVAVAVGVLIAYWIVSTMSWKRGEIEGQQEIITALSNITPAVDAIRSACREQWAANKWESDCALFFTLRAGER